jgi:hypothetical protein
MGTSNDLIREGIKLPGAALVRFHLDDLNSDDTIKIGNAKYSTNGKNNLVVERLYAPGSYTAELGIQSASGKEDKASIPVNVKGDYFFMVGLADVTVGKNTVTGTSGIEQLSSDHRYQDKVYTDGRVAFYLKGKISGKALITAQLDTGTDDIGEIFKGIHKKQRDAIFKRIDPDKYYPVYGDDSTITRDVDTSGKLYLRLDWDKSQLLWGNYNTGVSGNSLANYNRSLYGMKGILEGGRTVANGESQFSITGFAAEPDTLAAQDRFGATGVSEYYLRHQDLALGSAKVRKEILNDQGLVISSSVLTEGKDYEINEFQGRILLNKPFSSLAGDAGSLSLDNVGEAYLVVDYEYVADATEELTAGVRAKGWVNDQIGIGATYVNEKNGTTDYTLQGVDLTYRASEDTYLKVDYAKSEGATKQEINTSVDGGFTTQQETQSSAGGAAYRVDARVGFSDYSDVDGYAQGWYSLREAGFASTTGENISGSEKTDYGLALGWQVNEKFSLEALVSQTDEGTKSTGNYGAQADYELGKLTLSGQVKNESESDSANSSADRDRTTLGLQASYEFSDSLTAYLNGKGTVAESNWDTDNDSIGVGVNGQITDRLSYNLDVSSGLGDNAKQNVKAGLGYNLTDDYNVYANLSADIGGSTGLRDGAVTLGQRASINDKLAIYTEHQFKRDNDDRQITNSLGGDYALTERYSVGASYNNITVSTDNERQSVSLYGRYNNNDDLSFSNKVEWRSDKSSDGTEQEQFVFVNSLQKRINDDFRFLGSADFSNTKINNADDAKYADADIGFAYRPVNNNKFNALGMYSYIYNLDPSSQVDSGNFDERSHILSVEGIYEINPTIEVGAKLAYKKSEYKDRGSDSAEWYGVDSTLGVLRARYHLMNKWDALGEYRVLSTSDAGTESGALVALERQVGKNIKAGVGYNFSDFSDDPKNNGPDQSYEARGWFFNLVGKY